MNNFPHKFTIQILDKYNRAPISNIAVMITLFASRKNDYNFIPFVSNQDGIIEITKEWLEQEIQKEQNLFVMDYSSKLEDCMSLIEVRLMSEQMIENATKAMELYADYYKYTKTDIEQFRNVANFKYKPISKRYNLSDLQSFELVIELKRL